jgi:hypothetical protein
LYGIYWDFPNEFRISTFLSFIAGVSDWLIYISQLKFYMKAAVDAQIIQFEAQGLCRYEIWVRLHVGSNRVSRVFRLFRDNNNVPCIPPPGRPTKVTPEILDFIDVRTLQSTPLSLADLSSEVRSRFGTIISGSTVGTFKKIEWIRDICANRRIVIQTFWKLNFKKLSTLQMQYRRWVQKAR